MRYSGIDCPYCGLGFTDGDDIVTCPECGTPAHRECWEKAGGCLNRSRHAEGFEWTAPAAAPAAEDELSPPAAEYDLVCPACGSRSPAGTEKCPVCGLDLGMLEGQVVFEGNDPVGFRKKNEEQGETYDADGGGLRIDDIPAGEYAVYLGASAPSYIYRFRNMDRRETKRSWNWAAFFFGGVWCAHKGLRLYAVLILLFTLAVSVMSITKSDVAYYNSVVGIMQEAASGELSLSEYQNRLAEAAQDIPEDTEAWRTYLADALILVKCVLMGLYGDSLLRKKATADILTTRRMANDWQTYRRYLRYAGASKPFSGALYLVALGAVRVGAVFIARLIM